MGAEEANAKLHEAANTGDVEGLKAALSQGASLTCRDEDGKMAIHAASLAGHADAVKCLVDAGARTSATREEDNRTPLHLAVEAGHTSSVQTLLACAADVEACDFMAWRPLHVAASFGDSACTSMLLAAGAVSDAVDSSGNNALLVAAESSGMEWDERAVDYPAVVRLLVAAGCDPCSRDASQQPAILLATREGGTAVVEALIELGADVNAKAGTPPCAAALHVASASGNLDIVQALARGGCDMNVTEEKGMTAMHVALKAGLPEVAVELVKIAGVDPLASDLSGMTPLHIAAADGSVSVVEAIISALSQSHVDPYPPQCPPAASLTPLHLAAYYCHVGAVRALLQAFKEPAYVNARDSQGETPLMAAAKMGRAEVIPLLLDAGAELGVQNKQGKTAAQIAEAKGYEAVATMLSEQAGQDSGTDSRGQGI